MAHVEITGLSNPERVWISSYDWRVAGLRDQDGVRTTALSANEADFATNFDPYAFASTWTPVFDGLVLKGTGIGSPDASDFPTVGQVNEVTFTSSFQKVQLTFSGENLALGPLLGSIRAGSNDVFQLLLSGSDVIEGSRFNNSPYGIGVSDQLDAGPGDDTILGHGGRDILGGGDGDDLFSLLDHTTPQDEWDLRSEIHGGAGVNTVSYADAPLAITANLSDPRASHDWLVDVQRLIGSAFGDTLTGSAEADSLTGGGDTILAGDGADSIICGAGADSINGNRGEDTISGHSTVGDQLLGGQGNDLIDMTASSGHNASNGNLGDDTLLGGSGGDSLYGGQGDDSIVTGAGVNNVNGNLGQDTIVGHSAVGDTLAGGQANDLLDARSSTGRNWLNGNMGDDTVRGGDGGDSLHGGQGDDLVIGGSGSDWLSGDMGHDTLTGGAGADTFHVAANNTQTVITDFDYAAGDRLQSDAGTTYSLDASGADTLITLDSGARIIVQNIWYTNLPRGSILIG